LRLGGMLQGGGDGLAHNVFSPGLSGRSSQSNRAVCRKQGNLPD